MSWSRAADREHDQGGFTTLAVPFFFTMLFAVWLIAGPIALLAAPVIFRLALFLAPPSRAARLRRRAVKITTSTAPVLAVPPVEERHVREERSIAA